MKKIIIALSLLLLLVAPVSAEDATRSGKRDEFREKINQVRNEKKKQILEHISNQLQLINDKATQAMLNHLERLQSLVNKIKTRKPTVDTTAAQTTIDAAKAAVEAQAANEYVIEFNDETGLRVGASAAKTKLRADLKVVRDQVRLARQAVVDILQTVKPSPKPL